MSDASTPLHQTLCQAMDLCTRAVELYLKAAGACPEPAIAAVFERIAELKTNRLKKLDAMLAALAVQDVPAVCTLDEASLTQAEAVFSTAHASLPKTCPASALEAIDAGLALELEIKAFYEARLKQAEYADETRLLERLIQESNSQYIMLSELQHYYDDSMS
ncbi:ferritin family protein [Megalodesulfovibrio paquesii]